MRVFHKVQRCHSRCIYAQLPLPGWAVLPGPSFPPSSSHHNTPSTPTVILFFHPLIPQSKRRRKLLLHSFCMFLVKDLLVKPQRDQHSPYHLHTGSLSAPEDPVPIESTLVDFLFSRLRHPFISRALVTAQVLTARISSTCFAHILDRSHLTALSLHLFSSLTLS